MSHGGAYIKSPQYSDMEKRKTTCINKMEPSKAFQMKEALKERQHVKFWAPFLQPRQKIVLSGVHACQIKGVNADTGLWPQASPIFLTRATCTVILLLLPSCKMCHHNHPHNAINDMMYSHGTVVAGATGYEDESPAASDHPDVVLQTSQHHCKDTDNVSSGIWWCASRKLRMPVSTV